MGCAPSPLSGHLVVVPCTRRNDATTQPVDAAVVSDLGTPAELHPAGSPGASAAGGGPSRRRRRRSGRGGSAADVGGDRRASPGDARRTSSVGNRGDHRRRRARVRLGPPAPWRRRAVAGRWGLSFAPNGDAMETGFHRMTRSAVDNRTPDLLVVGGGTGGLSAAQAAAQRGADVVLIEQDRLGGECTYTGCVPSKSLIAAAHRGGSFDEAMNAVRRSVETVAVAVNAEALHRDAVRV